MLKKFENFDMPPPPWSLAGYEKEDESPNPLKHPKKDIWIVWVMYEPYCALYVDDNLYHYCTEDEGYMFGTTLDAVNLEYNSLELTIAEWGKLKHRFPKTLTELRQIIKKGKRKISELDPYGEEDWENAEEEFCKCKIPNSDMAGKCFKCNKPINWVNWKKT